MERTLWRLGKWCVLASLKCLRRHEMGGQEKCGRTGEPTLLTVGNNGLPKFRELLVQAKMAGSRRQVQGLTSSTRAQNDRVRCYRYRLQ